MEDDSRDKEGINERRELSQAMEEKEETGISRMETRKRETEKSEKTGEAWEAKRRTEETRGEINEETDQKYLVGNTEDGEIKANSRGNCQNELKQMRNERKFR